MDEKFIYSWFVFVSLLVCSLLSALAFMAYKLLAFYGIL